MQSIFRGTVFQGPCGNSGHGINLVGYGTTSDGVDYWVTLKLFRINKQMLLTFKSFVCAACS